MELNTINKTGTWSEAADRLNNNFSKTSRRSGEGQAERHPQQGVVLYS